MAGSRSVDESARVWIGITYFDGEEYFWELLARRLKLLVRVPDESERDHRAAIDTSTVAPLIDEAVAVATR